MRKRYHYVSGVRWYRWSHDCGDVRAAHVPKGWKAEAEQLDHHPVTGEPLKELEWWVREEFTGDDE